jgi:hypothetical protein
MDVLRRFAAAEIILFGGNGRVEDVNHPVPDFADMAGIAVFAHGLHWLGLQSAGHDLPASHYSVDALRWHWSDVFRRVRSRRF